MTANPFGVRRAVPDDAPALFEFLIPAYAESALQPVSPPKLRALIDRCVSLDQAIAGVISGPGGIEATIGMVTGEFDYTEHQHVAIKWNAVHPDFRRVNHGARLMSFARWCYEDLKERSPTPLPMIAEILTREPLEAKMRLLQRNIPQVGAFFSWGCVPDGAFDQAELGSGRGTKGRQRRRPEVVGHPSTVRRA